jgi:hypothetical protein
VVVTTLLRVDAAFPLRRSRILPIAAGAKPLFPINVLRFVRSAHECMDRPGVTLPDEQLIPEVIASLIRMTGGNFRLLTRLLTQIERVLSVNDLHLVSNAVVEAARDSLVIGTS